MSVLTAMLCPTCKGDTVTDSITGEICCVKCGIVLKDHSEYTGPIMHDNPITKDGESTQHSAVSEQMASVLSNTTPYKKTTDARGKKVPHGMQRIIKSEYQFKTAKDHIARNHLDALPHIKSLVEKLALPESAHVKAVLLYKKITESRAVRARSIKLLATTCLFVSCKQLGIPRTVKDFGDKSDEFHSDINRIYRKILQVMDLKIDIVRPVSYVDRIINTAKCSVKTKHLALDILSHALEKNCLVGRDPICMAATAIYVASVSLDDVHSKHAISQAANISNTAITNRQPEFEQLLADLKTS